MNKLRPRLSFAVLCGVSLILWIRPVLDTFALAASDSRYTYILLILPLAGALIFQGWRERGIKPQVWTRGVGLLIVALFIAGAARWVHLGRSPDEDLAIEMAGLVAWWIAAFAFSFGLPALRSLCFPLFFLWLVVPIPIVAMDKIVGGLQQGSLSAAQWLFLLFRVPVSREGITLMIPGLDIDVTSECSSIRSSLILVVTTMVLAHLLLKTPWRKVLLIALAIPLSIAKNGLRIFTIGMLGSRVDPDYLTGRLHHQGGIVFLLIALAVVFILLWILRRGERSAVSSPALSPRPTSPPLPPG